MSANAVGTVYVHENAGGKAALTARAVPPEIVLVNVPIRFMDCIELYKRIHAVLPNTVIIMKTTFVIEELMSSVLGNASFRVHYHLKSAAEMLGANNGAHGGGLELIVNNIPGACAHLQQSLEHTRCHYVVTNTYEDVISLVQDVTHRRFSV